MLRKDRYGFQRNMLFSLGASLTLGQCRYRTADRGLAIADAVEDHQLSQIMLHSNNSRELYV